MKLGRAAHMSASATRSGTIHHANILLLSLNDAASVAHTPESKVLEACHVSIGRSNG
jgi:hypothetical protein